MRAIVITAVIAVISGLVLQGTFFHQVLVYGAGVWIGLPFMLVLAGWWRATRRNADGVPRQLKASIRVFLIVVGAFALSLAVGVGAHQWTVFRARSFVDATVPKLERFRSWTGRFPGKLNELGDVRVPALLSRPDGYFSDGASYRFIYWDASGLMDGYLFDSATRRWTYFD